jgi:cytochrome c553
MAFLATALFAQSATAGNADNGRLLAYTCMGCHGIEGYRNAYPSYRVPKLGGQHEEYIVAALTAYRDNKRPHPTMQAHGASLSDRDIADIATYLQGSDAASDTATEDSVGGLDVARTCLACHGEGGDAVIPQPATLAGQQRSYIAHALRQYRDGSRSGTVMSAFAASLSDEDIENLAVFYSRQTGLYTPDKSK